MVALATLVVSTTREPSGLLLVLVLLGIVLAISGLGLLAWAVAYRQLTYVLTPDALLIRWFGHTVVIGYLTIEGIYTGQRLVGHAVPSVPRWPGIYVGPGRLRGLGRLRFFSTSPDPAALTLVTTATGGVVVSARNPHEFRAALIQRVQESTGGGGSTSMDLAQASAASPPWSALADRWLAWTLTTSLVLLVVMLGVIVSRYLNLPDQIPVRFDAAGQPSQIGPRSELMRLPWLGFIGIVVNYAIGIWLHARDQLIARVLWLAAIILQFLLIIAALRLTTA